MQLSSLETIQDLLDSIGPVRSSRHRDLAAVDHEPIRAHQVSQCARGCTCRMCTDNARWERISQDEQSLFSAWVITSAERLVYQHSLRNHCDLAPAAVPKSVDFPRLVDLLGARGSPKHDAVARSVTGISSTFKENDRSETLVKRTQVSSDNLKAASVHHQHGYSSVRSILALVSVWVAVAVAMLSIPVKAAGPLSISNVQVTVTSPGTALVTWLTSVPSTSQVVLVDSSYSSTYGSPIDQSLVTAHSVVLYVQPSSSYTYYVASVSQGVAASSANASAPTSFAMPPVDASAAPDYRLATWGAAFVYQGHDLYVGVTISLVAPRS